MEELFDNHLFSSSSIDIFPDNKLSNFTCQLVSPLFFNDNAKYQCALKNISFAQPFESKHELLGKDSIVFGTKNYPTSHNDFGIKRLLEIILSYNTTDPTIYNLYYFAPFLDENLVFNNNTVCCQQSTRRL